MKKVAELLKHNYINLEVAEHPFQYAPTRSMNFPDCPDLIVSLVMTEIDTVALLNFQTPHRT